ncbi:hypothetical protein SDC9_170631 [bioreactor metagenome]|uniref:Uncharacterized protein n=1 Tax=bioreactor metagenome TaxID=1076179 RepID=A0A645GHN9_9ZZZZ
MIKIFHNAFYRSEVSYIMKMDDTKPVRKSVDKIDRIIIPQDTMPDIDTNPKIKFMKQRGERSEINIRQILKAQSTWINFLN